MKPIFTKLVIGALLAAPLCMLPACTETVYERQRASNNWDGSKTIDKTTVRQNPDGTTTTDTDKVRVRN